MYYSKIVYIVRLRAPYFFEKEEISLDINI